MPASRVCRLLASQLILVAPLLLPACGPSGNAASDRLGATLGTPVLQVDSSSEYSYTLTYTVPVQLTGPDSARPTFVWAKIRSEKSTKAGESPLDTEIADIVVGGAGELGYRDFLSRCTTYSKGDCVERFVDPVYSVALLGYLEMRPFRK